MLKSASFKILPSILLFLLLSPGTAPAQEAPPPAAEKPAEAPLSGMTGVVKEVIDGCTVRLTSGETVRYRGVAVPSGDGPVWERMNTKATALNRKLVEGKKVVLTFDEVTRDPEGNLFGYVHVGDVLVNGELLASGYAVLSFAPPPLRHRDVLILLELSAREGNRGVWSTDLAPGSPKGPAPPKAPAAPPPPSR